KSFLEKAVLESTAAATGGGVTSGAEAAFHWDGTKSFEENLSEIAKACMMGAVGGAAGAAAFSVTFHLGGEVVQGLKGKFNRGFSDRLSQEECELVAKEMSKEKGVRNVKVEYDDNGKLVVHMEGDVDRNAILPPEPKEAPPPQGGETPTVPGDPPQDH